jgi:hypothetical protein
MLIIPRKACLYIGVGESVLATPMVGLYNKNSVHCFNFFRSFTLSSLFSEIVTALSINKMSTTTIEQMSQVLTTESIRKTNGSSHQRRDLETSIFHADEELYQKQLKEKGGSEDMWQGGDM